MSGDIEQLLVEDGLDALALYPAPIANPIAAVALSVRELRAEGIGLHHEPVLANWYHGGARGDFKKKVKQRLSRAAVELIPLDQQRAAELLPSTGLLI